jgi:uncharacterized DUF497 family protein
MDFEWDETKNQENSIKHSVSFYQAQNAFFDPHRVIHNDVSHSGGEPRFFCYGYDGQGVITIRFTIRANKIRIIGAGYWRKGRKIYERNN